MREAGRRPLRRVGRTIVANNNMKRQFAPCCKGNPTTGQRSRRQLGVSRAACR